MNGCVPSLEVTDGHRNSRDVLKEMQMLLEVSLFRNKVCCVTYESSLPASLDGEWEVVSGAGRMSARHRIID